MPDNPYAESVLRDAIRYQMALERADTAAINRLITAYRASLKRIEADLNRLIVRIGDTQPSQGQILRMEQYRSLVAQIAKELRDLEALTRTETNAIAEAAIPLGERDAARLLATTLTGDAGVYARFQRLPKQAITNLMGFLDPNGQLYKRISLMTPYYTDQVAAAMVDGLTRGLNPITIARQLSNEFGAALTDAMRTVRTANLWAYREASRANYAANEVDKWVWYAELDASVCMSCAAMHGTIHDMSEPLDDHHNGRCTMLPLSIFGNPVTQSGEDWFRSQSTEQQRAMMGSGKYQAWQEGKFEFGALSTQRPDEVYGQMRTETPLKDLIHD